MQTVPISFVVNKKLVEINCSTERSLLYILRRHLGLTGTKEGCSANLCGSCTVIVDSKAVNACHIHASELNGKTVETIEGLADGGQLHPLQQAFMDLHAVQCGYCTPGMIMAAKALLDKNPLPSRQEIVNALRRNLCRCTGYLQVIEAVEAAAGINRAEQETFFTVRLDNKEDERNDCQSLNLVGRTIPQVTALDKVTGTAKFMADLEDMPGMLWLYTVRSKYPHAKVVSIDTSASEAYPGVVKVLTYADVPGINHYGKLVADQPVLVKDRVRCLSDAVAIVVAENQEIARKAADLVQVEYQVLPGIFSTEEALKPDAPVIPDSTLAARWGKSIMSMDDAPLEKHANMQSHLPIRKGNVEQGFIDADHVIERTYKTQHVDHGVLECEGAIAYYADDGKLTVVSRGQHVYFDRLNIIRALGLPSEDVRVIQPSIGGSFGQGEDIYAQIHVTLAAMVTKRPVKAIYTREETMLATQKRHPITITLKTGFTKEGKITALEATLISDSGAYVSWGESIARKAAVHLSGPYEIPNIKIDAYVVYTNNLFSGPMRGFGVPQAAFAIESHVDEMAKVIGLDPLKMRLNNALMSGSLTATQQELPRAFAIETLEAAAEKFGWSDYKHSNQGMKRRGRGMASTFYGTGFGYGVPDQGDAIVELHQDGTATCWISTLDYGMGSNTAMTQIIGETLGLSEDRIRMVTGDSEITPDCGSSVATRVTYTVGNAVKKAAIRIRQDLLNLAAQKLLTSVENIVLKNNSVYLSNQPDKVIAVAALAEEMKDKGWPLRREGIYKTHQFTQRIDRKTGKGNAYWPYSYGTTMAEVEVDLESGKVSVLRVVAAQYTGRAINPQAVRGQVLGGLSMSLGYGLLEDMQMEEGRPGALNFDKYRLLRTIDMPEVIVINVESPDPHGPYGAVGIGEPTSVAGAPAVVNAIADALGVRVFELPANPPRVLASWQGKSVAGKETLRT